MQSLNYCRSMIKQFSAQTKIPRLDSSYKQLMSHAIDLAQVSEKFMLPHGGRLHDDPEYKALDDTQPLHLPYPYIALEYSRSEGRNDEVNCPKAVVLAREREESIVLLCVSWMESNGMWMCLPEVALPKTHYLDRKDRNAQGYVSILCNKADARIPDSDYGDELGTLLCFLNVLQCSNVHVEKIAPRKAGRKVKAALPFDAYHILTIDTTTNRSNNFLGGSHRSPREHLRRGHIRRLENERKVWINATVVAAGRSTGKITKDYGVRV